MQPPNPPQQQYPIHPAMVTVAHELHGFRLRSLGIVMGSAMRDPGVFDLWKSKRPAMLQSFEQARQEALLVAMGNARRLNANGIIAIRFDELPMTGASTDFAKGAQPTLVTCYGTACWAEQA